MIELSLPYPPTGNHAVKHTRNGHYATKEAKAYRALVAVLCRSKRPKKPFPGPLSVLVIISPPDRRRRDMDNAWKTLSDSLTHAGIWEDDSQIADLRLVRIPPVPGGSVAVRVEMVNKEINAQVTGAAPTGDSKSDDR